MAQSKTSSDVVGTVIAKDGVLNGLTVEKVPTDYENTYLTLTNQKIAEDGTVLSESTLFNQHIATSHVTVGSNLLTAAGIPYDNLFVKSVPPGAEFSISTEDNEEEPTEPPVDPPVDPPPEETQSAAAPMMAAASNTLTNDDEEEEE